MMDGACILSRLLDMEPECNDSLINDVVQNGSGSSEGAANDAAAPASISVESADRLSYYAFVERYMAPNIPVLIKGACHNWPALAAWANPDGSVNMEALRAVAGHCRVAVTDTAEHHHGCAPTVNMALEQYCRWWEDHHKQSRQDPKQHRGQHQPSVQEQQQPSVQEQQQPSGQQQQKQPLLYLKDFHYVGNFPSNQVYTAPKYFTEDWLNEYYDHKLQQQQKQQNHQRQRHKPSAVGSADSNLLPHVKPPQQQQQQQQESSVHSSCSAAGTSTEAAPAVDSSHAVTSDYRFVYCGPAGSWTAVHSDVLRSYSWSANVAGRKRWWLLPPQYTHLLQDCHGQLPTDFFDLEHWNFKHRTSQQQQQVQRQQQHQQIQQASTQEQQQKQHKHAHEQFLVELVQEVGDVLFVPSGWHHMVVNEVDTLSINHNWINAHNVHWSWALLRKEYETAAALLDDCRETACPKEFEQLVQNMLAANSGFSLQDFAEFLTTIISRRLQTVQQLHQQQQHAGAPSVPTAGDAAAQLKPAAEQRSETLDMCELLHSEATVQGLQLQLLHCALDIHRAARVLQQARDAYVAAAAYNVAWWRKHSSRMNIAGGALVIGRLSQLSGSGVSSCASTKPSCTAACAEQQLHLPTWIGETDNLLQTASQVVAQFRKPRMPM